jgi:hypothetical protein
MERRISLRRQKCEGNIFQNTTRLNILALTAQFYQLIAPKR